MGILRFLFNELHREFQTSPLQVITIMLTVLIVIGWVLIGRVDVAGGWGMALYWAICYHNATKKKPSPLALEPERIDHGQDG